MPLPCCGWGAASSADHLTGDGRLLFILTGAQCAFGSYSNTGDSGGPVYASIDGKLYAAGVVSFGGYHDYSGSETGAMEIANTMKQFGLKLYA